MTRPHGITGSLTPTFVPARAVALAVRRPSAFALIVRLPTALRAPLRASVTISGRPPSQTTASHGPRRCKRPLRSSTKQGWYFTVAPPRPKPWIVAPTYVRKSCRRSMAGYSKVTGSFCPDAEIESSPILQFRRAYGGDSRQVVSHSCRSELTRQGISLLRTVIVTAPFYRGFGNELCLAADKLR